MSYTKEQKAVFQQQFAALKRRQILVPILLLAPNVGFLIWGKIVESRGDTMHMPRALAAYDVLVIVALVIFTYWNLRCPACNRHLEWPIWGMMPSSCQDCGVELSLPKRKKRP